MLLSIGPHRNKPIQVPKTRAPRRKMINEEIICSTTIKNAKKG